MCRCRLIDGDIKPPKEGDIALRVCFGHDPLGFELGNDIGNFQR